MEITGQVEKRVTRKSLRSLSTSIARSEKDEDTEAMQVEQRTPSESQSMSAGTADEPTVLVPNKRSSRREAKPSASVDHNQSLNIDNREIIKTRSKNRLSLCSSLVNSDGDVTNKKYQADTTSNTQNETNSNEDSNSNCSSSLSQSQQATVQTTSTPTTRLRSQIITSQLNDTPSSPPIKAKSNSNINKKQRLEKKLSTMLTSPVAKSKTPVKQEGHEANVNMCPLNDDCCSAGHLSGKFETHCTLDTCPVYFNMTSAECNQKRIDLDKNLRELNDKLQRLSDLNKRLRGTVQQATNTHGTVVSTKEQLEYANDVEKRRTVVHAKVDQDNQDQMETTLSKSLNEDVALATVKKRFSFDDLNVPQYDLDIFNDVLQLHADLHEPKKIEPVVHANTKIIQFGDYEIETWYKSPYPEDYWQLPKIFLCEFCLKYMKTSGILSRHAEKCIWKHPPGKEIYRKNNLSFFEIDGKSNKIYCQNLCLLSKLFLDHKTLYFDVEPFLFYVLTSYNPNKGTFNMIGYFSKEKHSIMNFNLSCILILPQYMKQGYGKLLIDFSYLLSKIEEKIGSPERPLSDLGLISYRNYWKAKLLFFLNNFIMSDEICIKDLSHETAILPNDIISTFQFMGLIKYWKGKHVLLKDKELIGKYLQKWTNNLQVDETCLVWKPYIINKIDTTNHHNSTQLLNKLSSISS